MEETITDVKKMLHKDRRVIDRQTEEILGLNIPAIRWISKDHQHDKIWT